MATAAPQTLQEVEVFRHQARATHQVVRINAQGLTHEESLIQPAPAPATIPARPSARSSG